MHPMLNIAVRAAPRRLGHQSRGAGGRWVRGAGEAEERLRHQGRPRRGSGDYRDGTQGLSRPRGAREESGATPGQAEYQWIIDPLDGTTNFIHGFPQYCVSIAIRHRGALAHGVIYDPTKNELSTASKGRGAFLNDRRIRVSKCARLGDALVGTGFPFREVERIELYTRQLKTMMQTAAGVRRAGAAARPGLRSPAAGSTRSGRWAFPRGTHAGALMILEAGGLVGDLRGDAGYLDSGEIARDAEDLPALLEAVRYGGEQEEERSCNERRHVDGPGSAFRYRFALAMAGHSIDNCSTPNATDSELF